MEIRLIRTESFRLTALFAGLFIGAMLILGGVFYVIVDNAFESEILQSASRDLASIRQGYDAEGVKEAVEVVNQRLARPTASDFLLLQGTTGEHLAGNLPVMSPTEGPLRIPLPASRGGRHFEDDEGHEILGRGELIAPGLYAFAGRDLFVIDAAEEEAFHAVGWILAITLALAVGGGIFLSRGFLRRMDAITNTCQAIINGRLTDRIATPGTNDELGRLAAVINTMLDRISALIESIRQISTDIAHDLRTPLTRLRHRLELIRSETATVTDYEAAVDDVIRNTEQLLSTFAALLRIGQIEGTGAHLSICRVNIQELATTLAEIYRPAAEDQGHFLEVAEGSVAEVMGDRELLSQLFANLIENAIAHTPAGIRIGIVVVQTLDTVSVIVEDEGPGIPAEEREKVFGRFYRLERSRSTPGSGLGLSLVAAIVRIHHATIELADNEPGLRIVISFPRAR